MYRKKLVICGLLTYKSPLGHPRSQKLGGINGNSRKSQEISAAHDLPLTRLWAIPLFQPSCWRTRLKGVTQ